MTSASLGAVISSLHGDSLLKLDISENKVDAVAMAKLCGFLESKTCLEVGIIMELSNRETTRPLEHHFKRHSFILYG